MTTIQGKAHKIFLECVSRIVIHRNPQYQNRRCCTQCVLIW